MNAKVITNTKLALILYRFNLDKFKPIWKQKAKVVCKHTQRMRIMWERICENEATLPLFDEDYKFDHPLELFKPVAILTSQTNEVRLCDQSLALWKRTKAPLRGVPHKNGRPSLEELKELFWAEELQEKSYRRRQ
ncbi:hypothetical protein [Campylobacter devanensis]|uniref:hypothetical protein n=1 Tax=Campylobacter devanensis TaxID=3161138 RepID=UPI000A356339|nr:hypothetical protein [Campylobacter sp. P0107]